MSRLLVLATAAAGMGALQFAAGASLRSNGEIFVSRQFRHNETL